MKLRAIEPVPSPFTRKSRYILVVEGDTNDLFTTAMILHRFSYPVCTARNARQALDMVSVAMPALVITDFALPGMNGIDFLRVLGSNPHTISIPVLLLVPPGDIGHEMSDVEIGGRSILHKPVAVEDLYRAVQAAMESTPRTNIRVQATLPVTVNNVALDSARGECATHVSAHGLYIRTFKYHRPDEQIALLLTIGGRTVKADGRILYTRRQDSDLFMEPGMAVKFTRIMAEDREFIRQFVHDAVTRGIVMDLQ
ncbi:MAG: response regulator [Nitrospirota bacterium]